MVRIARVRYSSLKNSLINLPLSIHAQLLDRSISPQSLVVELSISSTTSKKQLLPPVKAYVGWTGMPTQLTDVTSHVRGQNSISSDYIEIDPQFAATLIPGGLLEGSQVSIELLRDLPTATSVSVTPLSADDWEILETNADFVETNLLNQVRAVTPGSIVGCWVGGTTLIKFIVDATVPTATPALLLTSDTELVVAPKTRFALPPSTTTKSHDLTTPSTSTSTKSQEEWESLTRRLVRLLPPDLSTEIGITPEQDDVGEGVLGNVWVGSSLFRNFNSSLGAGGEALKCALMHVSRPSSLNKPDGTGALGGGVTSNLPKESPQIGSGSDRFDQQLPMGGVGRSGGKSKEDLAIGKIEVRVKEGRNIPRGHVWVGEKVRKELGLADYSSGGGGFELLKFSSPLSASIKKARAKELEKERLAGTNNKPSSKLSFTTPPTNNILSPRSPFSRDLPLTSSALQSPVLAGVSDKLDQIKSHVINSLAAFQLASSPMLTSGILVSGASGAGKSSVVRFIGRELEKDLRGLTKTIYIDCSKHADERLPILKNKMKDWFDEACWFAPSVLILDNLDRILGAEVEHADSFPALHLAHTFSSTATPALASSPIVIIATAQSAASLHPLLSTTHLLGETVALRGPNKHARRDILTSLIKTKSESSNLSIKDLNYVNLAGQTEGYLPADLRDLVDRAIHQAAIRSIASNQSPSGLELTIEDFTSAQVGFVPLSLRDVKLQTSDVQWADIGGLHETRAILRETLEWPTKYGPIFATCPIRLRSGLLLYGYPGCGKTLLASAVAKECGLNFISVKGPEILNKYIGASEKSVRDLFERAQAAKPCILFFDEFDSIAPKRGHDSTGVTDRVVNQMLTQMDGAEGLDGVYVLAATSRPDLIDPALLRPGRLDKSLLCDMPNHNDRLEIMKACARKIALSPSVDLSVYAAQTEGFSGADLQALIYNAHLDAIHAGLDSEDVKGDSTTGRIEEPELTYTAFGGAGADDGKVLSRAEQASVTKRLELIMSSLSSSNIRTRKSVAASSTRRVTHVEESHLRKSLQATRPSVPPAELTRLRRIYTEFVSGRSANGLPSGEPSDEVGGRSSLM